MSDRPDLQHTLGHTFEDGTHLDTALTHASWANENGGPDNERLEFLGDAVLQACTTVLLMERFPELREGALSRLRSRLVSTRALAEIARELDVGASLRLGIGEEQTGGRTRRKVLACAVEALLGAVFVDGGFDASRGVVERWMAARIEALADEADGRWKDPRSLLQEHTQRELGATPAYAVTRRDGPAHEPVFEVQVRVGDDVLGTGEGPSKREASRRAASDALSRSETS